MAKKKNITKKSVQDTERKPYIPFVEIKPEVDDDATDDDGLTVKQRLFVAAIAGPARGNATKAAEMAGYRADNRIVLASTASENLRKPHIQEAIALALAKRSATPDWAKTTLVDMAKSSLSNFVSVGNDGEPHLDFAKAAAAGAIGQLKEFSADILPGEEGEQKVIRCKIKVHDRIAALGILLKLYGMLSDAGTGASPGELPMEKHPAAGRVKAPSGTAPPDEQSSTV